MLFSEGREGEKGCDGRDSHTTPSGELRCPLPARHVSQDEGQSAQSELAAEIQGVLEGLPASLGAAPNRIVSALGTQSGEALGKRKRHTRLVREVRGDLGCWHLQSTLPFVEIRTELLSSSWRVLGATSPLLTKQKRMEWGVQIREMPRFPVRSVWT